MPSSGQVTHGHTFGRKATRTYSSWAHMIQRCTNPNDEKYPNYGARGIAVCERWRSFENFLADMGECPKGLSIERKDNNGNYEPDNCKWATAKEQAANKRNNRLLTLNGKTQCVALWASETGIPRSVIEDRAKRGWSDVDTLTIPSSGAKLSAFITFQGRTQSSTAWAAETGLRRATIRGRIVAGWSPERALTTPVDERSSIKRRERAA